MRDGQQDELLAAVDRVAGCPADPAAFPYKVSPEFEAAAVELLRQIARIRFAYDGGDLEELDALDVDDQDIVIADAEDLREFVAGFHAERDQPRYAACAAVYDWLLARAQQQDALN